MPSAGKVQQNPECQESLLASDHPETSCFLSDGLIQPSSCNGLIGIAALAPFEGAKGTVGDRREKKSVTGIRPGDS
jgi:hypothetical protein